MRNVYPILLLLWVFDKSRLKPEKASRSSSMNEEFNDVDQYIGYNVYLADFPKPCL